MSRAQFRPEVGVEMFNFDWFHRGGLERLKSEARMRCARAREQRGTPAGNGSHDLRALMDELEMRVILYMKDGLTYEMKEMVDIGMSSALTFECVPMDENYKVGAIVLVVPFEDIARVEVFAVHPSDRPTENVRIPGFRSAAADSGRD